MARWQYFTIVPQGRGRTDPGEVTLGRGHPPTAYDEPELLDVHGDWAVSDAWQVRVREGGVDEYLLDDVHVDVTGISSMQAHALQAEMLRLGRLQRMGPGPLAPTRSGVVIRSFENPTYEPAELHVRDVVRGTGRRRWQQYAVAEAISANGDRRPLVVTARTRRRFRLPRRRNVPVEVLLWDVADVTTMVGRPFEHPRSGASVAWLERADLDRTLEEWRSSGGGPPA